VPSSTREKRGVLPPNRGKTTLEFPSNWKDSLVTLEWTSGDENLSCDDALLDRHRGAREVNISSTQLTSAWALKLLSSNSRFQKVSLRTEEATLVNIIEPMNLPNLNYLFLNPPPKSTQTGDSSLFFKNLNTPRMRNLQVARVNPQDLSFFSITSSLEQLFLYDLQITDHASLPKQLPPLLSTRSRTCRSYGAW